MTDETGEAPKEAKKQTFSDLSTRRRHSAESKLYFLGADAVDSVPRGYYSAWSKLTATFRWRQKRML